ncbi:MULTISPECIES: tyrosine--tRNA ligase [unclassified Erysipelothrix]|uniref:tyrosine--tRNA ligase n=1 Tax=unclassified Erysipelothrix TaxID=2624170 RepID=UPI0013780B18|nr:MULTISPECIES: tyrosine--tRNA ligase [unclassified Erysipelothrix]MBK2401853.1 tyrosine--tRNA ligase [Erysipelothrix sp. strain 2 (EsS2-6-Brazil)]MBK2404007.1 tyrosine--tRNA ligase [Erysipelothrix sp. strain 2 (EsS2-7-Brazil)]NBA00941.1 tyrosine--tRNA ligase [Erysipelothrix rhusiopathiae]
MNFLEELNWRGLVKDVTNYEALEKRLEQPITLYCGFDPTADSLHVGHLQQLILLKRYQMQGHKPIALVGGATGMIGDPRPTTERSMLDDADLQKNVDGIGAQIERILSSDNNPVTIVNNRDWLGDLTVLDFLRDYGKFFSVSNMLAKDTIAKRLSTGISFTEFSYTILQSIDFLHLYKNYGIELQIGGSDQWGNLVSGADLIRKVEGPEAEVFGITSHLIMKSDGTKFGKSEGQNIWLDENRTDAYSFYQFFINTSDDDVIDFLKRLSFKSVEEIQAIEASFIKEPHLRLAQKELAKELTEVVFGKEGLAMAERVTNALFSGNVQELTVDQIRQVFADSASIEVTADENIVELLVNTKVCPSKREARQLIEGGAIRVNGEVVSDTNFVVSKENAIGKEVTVVRRGKKTYHIFNHTN